MYRFGKLERCRTAGRTSGERDRDLILEWMKEGYSTETIAKLLRRPEEFVRKIQEEAEALV